MRFLSLAVFWTGMALLAVEPHWAYAPLGRPSIPEIEDGVSHPVDAFIRAGLKAHGLRAAPEADRPTLLRRIHFDLIGLPPSPEDHRRFLADPSPEAYEREVDRLLALPRYGERWARHWMDAVHFAETHGHDQDRIREQAWPYRDYLIEAFNADRPYARFIQEQVAGDVLFPDRPEATVALGMAAAGPWDESTLRDIREDTLDRQLGRYVDRDDMISTVVSVSTAPRSTAPAVMITSSTPFRRPITTPCRPCIPESNAPTGSSTATRRSMSVVSTGCISAVRWSVRRRSCWNPRRHALRSRSG